MIPSSYKTGGHHRGHIPVFPSDCCIKNVRTGKVHKIKSIETFKFGSVLVETQCGRLSLAYSVIASAVGSVYTHENVDCRNCLRILKRTVNNIIGKPLIAKISKNLFNNNESQNKS